MYSSVPKAIGEVVVNGYDPDASLVTVTSSTQSIVVDDNGSGMGGAEWYVFRDGPIAEIRAYELVGGDHAAELAGYPYAARGYPLVPKLKGIGTESGDRSSRE